MSVCLPVVDQMAEYISGLLGEYLLCCSCVVNPMYCVETHEMLDVWKLHMMDLFGIWPGTRLDMYCAPHLMTTLGKHCCNSFDILLFVYLQ